MTSRLILICLTLVGIFSGAEGAPQNVAVTVLKAPSPAVIDGENNFVYELVIENQGADTVQLKSLQVEGGALGSLKLDERQLASRFMLLGLVDYETVPDWSDLPKQAREPNLIPGGRSALIFLQLVAPLDVSAEKRIRNKIELEAVESKASTHLTYDVAVKIEAPVVLSSPFVRGLWFPFNGPEDESAHRRSVQRIGGRHYIAQRFAIDWGGVCADGHIVLRDADLKMNSSFCGQGVPVLAVADAIVEEVTDGIPENIPGAEKRAVPINIQTVAGNQVILNLGNNRFALYAHLKPGSLRVRKGDRVKRGQEIGLLGNSGNSTGPHLHFHVCDGPSALECQGIPYVFDFFVHQVVTASGDDLVSLKFTPVGASQRSERELIWRNQLIRFSEEETP